MCKSEIHQLHIPGFVNHQIFRLEVPVHDALRMGFAKAIADLACHVDGLADIQRAKAIQHTPQALALHELHRDESGCSATVEVVNAANVLVCDSPSESKFIFQTFDDRKLIRDFRSQYFQREYFAGLAIIFFELITSSTNT